MGTVSVVLKRSVAADYSTRAQVDHTLSGTDVREGPSDNCYSGIIAEA